MNPEAYVQGLLSEQFPGKVAGSVPPSVPDPFIMHTTASSTPVSNGDATASIDTTVAVSVSAKDNNTAREAAFRVVEIFQDAYNTDKAIGGQHLGFFEAQMLPVRQPSTTTTNSPSRIQYDAIYRLIFAV